MHFSKSKFECQKDLLFPLNYHFKNTESHVYDFLDCCHFVYNFWLYLTTKMLENRTYLYIFLNINFFCGSLYKILFHITLKNKMLLIIFIKYLIFMVFGSQQQTHLPQLLEAITFFSSN